MTEAAVTDRTVSFVAPRRVTLTLDAAPVEVRVGSAGEVWLHCASCRRRIGEIVGDRIVRKSGSTTSTRSVRERRAIVCHHCDETNALPES